MGRRGCDWRFHLSSNDACSRQSDLPWLRCANLGLKKRKKGGGEPGNCNCRRVVVPVCGRRCAFHSSNLHASALPRISVLRKIRPSEKGQEWAGRSAKLGTRQPYNGGVGSVGRAPRSDPRSPEVNSSLEAAQDNVHPTRDQCWRGNTRSIHGNPIGESGRRGGDEYHGGFGELGDAPRNCSFANLLLLQVAGSGTREGSSAWSATAAN